MSEETSSRPFPRGTDGRVDQALAACPSVRSASAARDRLWFAVRDLVCTTSKRRFAPAGSCLAVEVTADDASAELLAAMRWLLAHEEQARRMPPAELARALLREAHHGTHGSARAARADQLHGLTEVPAGVWLGFAPLDEVSGW